MDAIKTNYGDCFDNIIITVPNAFWLQNLRFAFRTREGINTDHRHWFSPFTLLKHLRTAGFMATDIFFADYWYEQANITYEPLRKLPFSIILNILALPRIIITSLLPALRGVIICECTVDR